MYPCNRCGKYFGSHSGVTMHMRRRHFDRSVCDKCGNEIFARKMKEHISTEHSPVEHLPDLFKPPAPKASKMLRPIENVEEDSFWEVSKPRLSRFVASGAATKCRLCGKTLGGVHGREQHEREQHRFTTQTKGSLALRLHDWNILEHLGPGYVDDYVRHELIPPLSCSLECNNEVNILVDFLLEQLPFQVSHVIRGGSYGKDTCLQGHSDLDMVMFIPNFLSLGAHKYLDSQLRTCLNEVKLHIQSSPLATRILISKLTKHSLRFQYKCYKDDHIHHVDLMPSHDWLGSAPSMGDKKEVYEMIANSKNPLEIQLLNSSLLQLQIDFVRRRSTKLRQLIRLVKHWRMTSFGDATSLNKHRRLPNSYTLELIVIHTWEKAGKPIYFKLRHGLAAVLQTLVDYENLCVAWTENYTRKNHLLQRVLQSPRPVVVDPANPNNNVCESSNTWDEIAYVAQVSLQKPLFKGIKLGQWK